MEITNEVLIEKKKKKLENKKMKNDQTYVHLNDKSPFKPVLS